MRTVIIDDEAKARLSTRRLLELYCPDVAVLGEASGVQSGIQLVEQEQPDLLFLDIKMKDGSGFQLLDHFEEIDFQVVFVTAFDEFAIKAFHYNAIHYLQKPIVASEMVASVRKASESSIKPAAETWRKLSNDIQTRKLDKLALPTHTGFHMVAPNEILRCQADSYYTQFHLLDGRKIIVSKTLKFYEGILQERGFARVHQSHLINLDTVVEYRKHLGGMVVLLGGEEIPVSTSKKNLLFEQLNYR